MNATKLPRDVGELTREEVATMWIYGREYAAQKLGIKDFYRRMPSSYRDGVKRFLQELDRAPRAVEE